MTPYLTFALAGIALGCLLAMLRIRRARRIARQQARLTRALKRAMRANPRAAGAREVC